MDLCVWPGDWELPSFDTDCLQALAYVKFCGADCVNTVRTVNPLRCSSYQLPEFRDGLTSLTQLDDIAAHLQQKGFHVGSALSPRQKADVCAWTRMLEEKLYPAISYSWWLDARNCTEVTRKWYAGTVPFPLNLYFPRVWESRHRSAVQAVYGTELCDKALEKQVYGRAGECFNALSHLLGDKQYLQGESPSELDARVFGCLAPILRVPFPNTQLSSLLKSHQNLVTYVNNIFQRYFPTDKATSVGSTEARPGISETEFPHKRRNLALFSGASALLMMLYALVHGIVKINSDDFDNEYDIEDLED